MTAKTFARVMIAFVVLTIAAWLVGKSAGALHAPSEPTFIASKWKNGLLVGRTVTKNAEGAPLDEIEGTLVFERTSSAWRGSRGFRSRFTSISWLAPRA